MFMKNFVKFLLFTFVVSLVVACGGKDAPRNPVVLFIRRSPQMLFLPRCLCGVAVLVLRRPTGGMALSYLIRTAIQLYEGCP